jgi:hypothetical protein
VTGTKVAGSPLTGVQVNASTLGVVAKVVGASLPELLAEQLQHLRLPAELLQDREGVVHLGNDVIFQLPPGYRPASGKLVSAPAVCGFVPAADGSVTMVNAPWRPANRSGSTGSPSSPNPEPDETARPSV